MIIIWGIIPIISIPLLLYLALNNRFSITIKEKYFLLFITALSFGLVAYTVSSAGIETSDVVRYRDIYNDAIGQDFRDISPLNYFFNIINWILANYVSSNGQFLSLFWSTVTISFALFASLKIILYLFEDRGDLYFILILLSLIIIPFITTTEMIKQTTAFSIFFFAISKKITKEKYAIIFFIISFLIHPQSVIFIIIIYFYNNKYINKYIIQIFIISFIFSFINILDFINPLSHFAIFNLIDLSDKIEAYKNWDQWGGSKRYYIIFAMMAIQIAIYIYQYYKQKDFKNDLSILGILIISVLLFNMSNQHDFARLIIILFPFQILVTLFDIKAFNKVNDKKIVIALLFSFYLISNSIYTYKQLNSDESRQSYMDNNWIRILTSNVSNFFQYQT